MEQTEIQRLMDLPLTGAGNAERLQALLAENWRYVPQIKRWLRWNGRFWQEEEEAAVYVAAVTAFRQLSAAIRSLPASNDTIEMLQRQSISAWLEKAEHASKMKDAFLFLENLAKEEYSSFDANPLLLNVQNGTLNLDSGELQPHNRQNLLTKICSASYEETPASPLWEETVKTILPDPAVRRWVQKFMGYCLTGSTEEEKFLIAYGPGGCGKGTFFETIAALMGDFKAVVPIDTLLAGTFYTN
ncbi:MAG: hypothetical protein ABS965_06430, partial [Succiniclasticum sp.]